MRICIVGLGGDVPFAEELRKAVKKEFGEEISVLKTVPMDRKAYDEGRGQYDAEKMLAQLAKVGGDCEKAFGIASADLFIPRLNFVFGLSEMGGREGIVSTARLKEEDGTLFKERFLKEALHELGHLHGLGHCTNGKCLMRFSNSLHEVDSKGSGFCERCKARL